jgi:two-component system, cell cycle sensor histidine kinase and response regulator CckA
MPLSSREIADRHAEVAPHPGRFAAPSAGPATPPAGPATPAEPDVRDRFASAAAGRIPAWQIGAVVIAFSAWDAMVAPSVAPITFLVRAAAAVLLVLTSRRVAAGTNPAAHENGIFWFPVVLAIGATLPVILTRSDPTYLLVAVALITYAFGIVQPTLTRALLLALGIAAIAEVAIAVSGLPPDRMAWTTLFLALPVATVAIGNRFHADLLRQFQDVQRSSLAIGSFFSDAAASTGDEREAFELLARRTAEALAASCVAALVTPDGRFLDPVGPGTETHPDDPVAAWLTSRRAVDLDPGRDVVLGAQTLLVGDPAAFATGASGVTAGATVIPSRSEDGDLDRAAAACHLVIAPIRRDDATVGIVAAWRPAAARPIEPDAIRLLGSLCHAAGIVVERRRAAVQLGDAAARLEAIVAASPIAMILLDKVGRVQLWNAAAEAITGWPARDVLDRPIEAFDGPLCLAVHGLLDGVLAGSTIRDREVGGPRRDGTMLRVSLQMAPVHDRAGGIVGAVAEFVDIEPRVRLESELLQAQKLESVGRLAGGIAHDFNNMLTAIIGAASLLELELGPERRARREVEAINLAADRAAQLTRQLLGFARKAVLAPAEHELNAIVGGIQPMLERLLGERIAVMTSLDPDVGSVTVDRTQLEQVLVNLAINARDAMPDGGALLFRTSLVDRAGLPSGVVIETEGRIAILDITDTGVGMSDDVRRHAFEPFYTTKGVGKGTGLGLATSYGVIRQSGGDIVVETAPGAGTTLRIFLPVTAPRSIGVVGAAPDSPVCSEGGTILLVEDEANVRALVRRMLERAGYAVLDAPNGEAAVSMAGGCGRIDVLVSDVVMPGMTGPELHDRLLVSRPELPVVFMTGYVANPDVRDALDARRSHLLIKPFGTDTLLGAVAGARAAARPPAEAVVTVSDEPATGCDGAVPAGDVLVVAVSDETAAAGRTASARAVG